VSPEPDYPSTELDRTCPECLADFTVDSAASRRKYCSPTCQERGSSHLPRQRTCPQCGEEYTTTHSQQRKYCSDQCRTAARATQTDTRTCPVCEGAFQALKSVRKIYCSPVCRREAEHRRDRALNEDRARRLGQTLAPPPARTELPWPPLHSAQRRTATARDPLEPTATRDCPHCQQPITIVALLATPEAARPTMPHLRTDIVPIRRTQ
jgi:endogenous inhibitor of DNA gyrase (YacG/DUF329 family)